MISWCSSRLLGDNDLTKCSQGHVAIFNTVAWQGLMQCHLRHQRSCIHTSLLCRNAAELYRETFRETYAAINTTSFPAKSMVISEKQCQASFCTCYNSACAWLASLQSRSVPFWKCMRHHEAESQAMTATDYWASQTNHVWASRSISVLRWDFHLLFQDCNIESKRDMLKDKIFLNSGFDSRIVLTISGFKPENYKYTLKETSGSESRGSCPVNLIMFEL